MGRGGMSIGLGAKLYKMFIRPLLEFASHLTPLTGQDTQAVEALEYDAMRGLIRGLRKG